MRLSGDTGGATLGGDAPEAALFFCAGASFAADAEAAEAASSSGRGSAEAADAAEAGGGPAPRTGPQT